MRDKLQNAMARLETAVRALEQAVSNRLMARVKILVRHIMITCEECGGVFQTSPDGLRCAHCKRLIPVVWPDGRTPTIEELHYMLAIALHDRPEAASNDS